MKKMKVVRITKEEYELDDGTVVTHVSKLDEVPSLEEFQSYIDEWYEKLVTPYEERNEG